MRDLHEQTTMSLDRIASALKDYVPLFPGTLVSYENGKVHLMRPDRNTWVVVRESGPSSDGSTFTIDEYRPRTSTHLALTCAWEVITWAQKRIFDGFKS